MEYGDKYARIFLGEVRDGLSDKGKKWVDSTRRILQQKIEEKIASGEMNELDPEAFEQQAFEMHSDAYRAAGINDLPVSDALQILNASKADLASLAALREAAEVGVPYVGNKTVEAGEAVGKKMDQMIDQYKWW